MPADLLERLPSATLLTPNERLAREYHRSYALARQRTGATSWRTPRILSLDGYLRAELQRALARTGSESPLISRAGLLHAAVSTRQQAAPHIVARFVRAWELGLAYDLDAETIAKRSASRFFADWLARAAAALPAGAVPEVCLGDHLVELGVAPAHDLLVAHAEELTLPQQRYLAFADKMRAVQHVAPTGTFVPAAQPHVQSFETLQAELTAACEWARSAKLEDPHATVGIVVPQLTERYETVLAQCGAVLDPATGSPSTSFDIAGGMRLTAQPVWQAARTLLEALRDAVTPERVARLAASPYLALPELERLLTAWPTALPRHASASQTARALDSHTWHQLAAYALPDAAPAAYEIWLARLEEVLAIAGWPHTAALGSVQFQAAERARAVLRQGSVAAPRVPQQLSFEQALTVLEATFDATFFAPARAPADILLMGALETTGLAFSHLWVCGMDEHTLPQRSLSPPFLPRRLAAEAGIPRSTQEQELVFARRQVARWREAAAHVRFSYVRHSVEGDVQASPLLASLPEHEGTASPHHPHAVPQAGLVLERYADERGEPLAPAQATDTRGGVGLLRDQALCPFRAYAIHRLALRPPERPTNLPDALQRGIVLHAALQALLESFPSQTALAGVSGDDLATAARRALRAVRKPLPPAFAEHELDRIQELLRGWLELEAKRRPFELVAAERAYQLAIGGLQIHVRVDRIDRVDEHAIIIDYKSGNVSLNGALTSPLTAPQLPIYALVEPAAGGVFFAQVSADRHQLVGISDSAELVGAGRTLRTRIPDGGFDPQRSSWRDELARTATDYRHGYASVSPQPEACKNCHLQAVCRIQTLRAS